MMKNFEKIYKETNKDIRASKDFAEKTRERLQRESSGNPFSARKMTVVLAAVLLLTVLFAGTVYAVRQMRETRLSETVQFSSAADIYTEKVSRSVEHDGLILTLSEALYENGKLYVTFNWQGENYADAISVMPVAGGIFIDGTNTPCTYIGTCSDYGGSQLYTLEYDLTDVLLEDAHSFSIGIDNVEIMLEGGENMEIKGPWEYSFDLNVSTLDSETVVYHIGKELKLTNGDTLIVEQLICTPLSQRIYYTVNTDKNNGFASSTRLSAVDEKRVCQFEFIEMSNNKGQSVNINPDNFSADAESISLCVTVTDRYDNILLAPTDILCKKQN